MAPMDDPQLTVLVIVDSPKGVQYGSTTAAPVAQEFFENALPYLGIAPNYTDAEERELKESFVYVPDVTGEKYENAVGVLKDNKLKYKAVPESGIKNFKVVDQYPKAGQKVKKGTRVYLYRE